MKSTHSVLFFYLFFASVVSSIFSTSYAQKSVDCLTYYYTLALNPKNSGDLGSAYDYVARAYFVGSGDKAILKEEPQSQF